MEPRVLQRARDPLGVYRRRFRWLVSSADRPIAVFIDDLDRCQPSYVVALLEASRRSLLKIRSRTSLPPTGVGFAVLATAYDELRDAVDTPGRTLGYLFLEKTFQISMEIPPMSFQDRLRYWERLTTTPAPPDGRRRFARELSAAFSRSSTQQDVEQRANTLIANGESEDDVLRAAMRRLNSPALQRHLEKTLAEFAPLLENNPRQ